MTCGVSNFEFKLTKTYLRLTKKNNFGPTFGS